MLHQPRNVNVDVPGTAEAATDGNHSAGPQPPGTNGIMSGSAAANANPAAPHNAPQGAAGGGNFTGPHDYSASWKIGTTDGYYRATPAYNASMGRNSSSGNQCFDTMIRNGRTPSPPPPLSADHPHHHPHHQPPSASASASASPTAPTAPTQETTAADGQQKNDDGHQQSGSEGAAAADDQARGAAVEERGLEAVRQGVAALGSSSANRSAGGGGGGSISSISQSSDGPADAGAGAAVWAGAGAGAGAGTSAAGGGAGGGPNLSGLSQQQSPGGPSTELHHHHQHPHQLLQHQQSLPNSGRSSAPPSLPPVVPPHQSLYQDRLFNQPSSAVEAVLSASCEALGFDIAEMWLRTGPKTHQLTNSHLRPTALEDSVRAELVDVYYGEMSSQRTHRLSPALCKRAKEAQDVVWVTANTERGAEALKCSISDVRTAVAVPVCHEMSNTNITLIFFSIRRAIMKAQAVEFLVHMSLSAAVSSVNPLSDDIMVDDEHRHRRSATAAAKLDASPSSSFSQLSRSEHVNQKSIRRATSRKRFSVTGACLDLKWNSLKNVEYLTDGGNNWIHTAVMNGRPVVVKTLKPECQDLALAINEIEGELQIHSKLDHPFIVGLLGAGTTSKGSRFVVLERLDGGTLTQRLGYDTRIRDRRRRFWKKKQFSYLEVLTCARSVADAMSYCHGSAIPDSMVLHRDLKPDNIGFTLDGTVKLIDFGLARVVDHASPDSDEIYQMSGETGSLRYMAPEVADCQPYNHKADVYSFGTILWEIVAYKKPYDGMSREEFYARVVHGGERPMLGKKWPEELAKLIQECWDVDPHVRPTFKDVTERLDYLLMNEKGGGGKKGSAKRRISALIDRHSTWF